MIVVPAVDVRGGRVVRLKQGRLAEEQVYGSDPVEVARRWEAEGAERLHLVDLDAAIEGRPQREVVEDVLAAVKIPVEVGGGLRTLELATRYRERFADRVIFGTAAVADPGVVKEALLRWPEAVAIALDARGGKVTVAGWKQTTRVAAVDLARQVRDWGVLRIQHTDTQRDGTLVGPNVAATAELARLVGLRITAAGGISRLQDLLALRDASPLIDEVVIGKALYEGRFSLRDAREALR
ncbi:MAG: HisA/HisF-related TIM barrel protein [Vicinamibacteria bacterium]